MSKSMIWILPLLMVACIGDDLVFDEVDPIIRIMNPVDTIEINSTYQFEVVFFNNIGQEDAAQVQAFTDTWTWNDKANEGFDEIVDNKSGLGTRQSVNLILGLEKVLGKGSLLAYLVSMTLRIAEIHRTLKIQHFGQFL